ncbi:MAG: right-handed parallel beta-helix repeat-containing protein [Clostridia bacterium]|nr:right-handed parallel beta-helix repeat-containing protein [Clostridia bacterium]
MAIKDYLSHFHPTNIGEVDADIQLYVSKIGDDNNPGTETKPFLTIERSLIELINVRKSSPNSSVSICINEGTYQTRGLQITKEMSGSTNAPVTIYGKGYVHISGGITIDKNDFKKVAGDVKQRLSTKARSHVYVADLKKMGIGIDDYGPLFPIGWFQTTDMYDNIKQGNACECFCNGSRMTLARYPKDSELSLGEIIDEGENYMREPREIFAVWSKRRNPFPGIYKMEEKDRKHISKWAPSNDIWMAGYPGIDWADLSARVKIDPNEGTIRPELVSRYGAKKGTPYHFFNVLDELNAPGEWYLDRDNALLYVWPTTSIDDAIIELSLSEKAVITISDTSYITLEGLDVGCGRVDGISIENSSYINVIRSEISNVGGNGVTIVGDHNMVRECEIHHTGKGGVHITGGNRETLTPGACMVDNNHIHDFAIIHLTMYPGVALYGVGNICSHNEIHNAPHMAVYYSGNDHVIEYNYIHEMVLRSSDAGAIYGGRDWTMCGIVVRYNVLENIGAGKYKPTAIYWDDAISGQTAYGNFIMGAGDNGIKLGGGRDLSAKYNIIINTTEPIHFDDRLREAVIKNGWAREVIVPENSVMWQYLHAVPFKSQVWADRYPHLARISEDRNNVDSIEFAGNPSYGDVENNIIVHDGKRSMMVTKDVLLFSKVENNPVFKTIDEVGFVNPADGNYNLKSDAPVLRKIPDFPNIPFASIGQY